MKALIMGLLIANHLLLPIAFAESKKSDLTKLKYVEISKTESGETQVLGFNEIGWLLAEMRMTKIRSSQGEELLKFYMRPLNPNEPASDVYIMNPLNNNVVENTLYNNPYGWDLLREIAKDQNVRITANISHDCKEAATACALTAVTGVLIVPAFIVGPPCLYYGTKCLLED